MGELIAMKIVYTASKNHRHTPSLKSSRAEEYVDFWKNGKSLYDRSTMLARCCRCGAKIVPSSYYREIRARALIYGAVSTINAVLFTKLLVFRFCINIYIACGASAFWGVCVFLFLRKHTVMQLLSHGGWDEIEVSDAVSHSDLNGRLIKLQKVTIREVIRHESLGAFLVLASAFLLMLK